MPTHPPLKRKPRKPRKPQQIEYVPLDSLTCDPLNARKHSAAQIAGIARSIVAFDFNVPILTDKDRKILCGHARFLALKSLGVTDVSIIRLEHLTAAQARAFAIAENRLAEKSEWDERLLGEHFKALADLDLDFSLEATGFTMGEIDLKIEGLGDLDPGDDLDDAPIEIGPAVAKVGDLWVLGRHRLLCASALDVVSYERLLEGRLAAMILTDPPYNVRINGHVSNVSRKAKRRHREFAAASGEMTEPEFTAFLTNVSRLMAAASADGALHYIFMDWRHAFALMAVGRSAYDDLINICVWAKPSGGMGGLYRSAHELVLVFKHGHGRHRNNVQLGKFGRNLTNVWNYPGAAGMRHGEDADLTAQHPTPKPVSLLADAIMDASARGDIILDPFAGSGATLIAAERVGRSCRAMELDPLYVDLIIRRWQRHTGEAAIMEGSGETFDALAAGAEAA